MWCWTLKNKNKEKFELTYIQVIDCTKKGKSTWFLALKIWALAVLKFFDVVLKFELPNARVLNFPQNSAPSLIGLVLIIGDCVYAQRTHRGETPYPCKYCGKKFTRSNQARAHEKRIHTFEEKMKGKMFPTRTDLTF